MKAAQIASRRLCKSAHTSLSCSQHTYSHRSLRATSTAFRRSDTTNSLLAHCALNSFFPSTFAALPQHFFVYGTLRDDDPSPKAPWNRAFVSGALGQPATLRGFKLFGSHRVNFPFAMQTQSHSDVVVGRLLHWDEALTFQQKLDSADQIEGFVGENDPANLYDRNVVTVQDESGRSVEAVVYHMRPGKMRQTFEIAGGDWLGRQQCAFASSWSP